MCMYPIIIRGNTFPCGKCVECKIKKSTEWAYRVMDESKQYEYNCFVTLTYNEEHLPQEGNLSRRDLTLFIKRLRKKLGKLRYFACGEYGSRGKRPHYHIILFGVNFEDKYFYRTDNKGEMLYRSPTLEKLWQLGYSAIGELSFDSAKYCAKYLQKVTDSKGKVKPFVAMSLKPGIGANAVHIDMLTTDKIYHNGKYISTPRYYLKLLEKSVPSYVEEIKQKRVQRVKNSVNSVEWYLDLEKRRKKFQKKFGFSIDSEKGK